MLPLSHFTIFISETILEPALMEGGKMLSGKLFNFALHIFRSLQFTACHPCPCRQLFFKGFWLKSGKNNMRNSPRAFLNKSVSISMYHLCNAHHNGYPTRLEKYYEYRLESQHIFFCNLSHSIPCSFAHGFYFLFQAKVYWERVLQLLLYFLFKLQCIVVVQHCTFLHILCLYNSTIQY